MTWILAITMTLVTMLTPVQGLMELEGIETGVDSLHVSTVENQDDATRPVVSVSAAPTSGTPTAHAATSSVAVETVTEDDQGDIIVSHPDEPFTYTVTEGRITVTPAVHTSVLISAHPWPVPEWGDDGYGPDWWEAYHDMPTTFAELTFPLGCVKYGIVVIVNGHSQVSNLTGEVGCE